MWINSPFAFHGVTARSVTQWPRRYMNFLGSDTAPPTSLSGCTAKTLSACPPPPMSALGHKQTSDATPDYVCFRGLSGYGARAAPERPPRACPHRGPRGHQSRIGRLAEFRRGAALPAEQCLVWKLAAPEMEVV